MKKDNLIYLIKPWRIEQDEVQYIAYLNYDNLDANSKENALKVASYEGHETNEYMYFSIVHLIDKDGITIPEKTPDGKNISMCQRKYMEIMENNHNVSFKKVAFIGFLPKKTVKYFVKSIAGFRGLLKLNFNGGRFA